MLSYTSHTTLQSFVTFCHVSNTLNTYKRHPMFLPSHASPARLIHPRDARISLIAGTMFNLGSKLITYY